VAGLGIVGGALLAITIAVIMAVGEWLKNNDYLNRIVEFIYVIGSLFIYSIICGIVEYLTLYILFPNEIFMAQLSKSFQMQYIFPSYGYITMFIIDTLLYGWRIWIFGEVFEDDTKSALYVFGWIFIIQTLYFGEIYYSFAIAFVKVLIAFIVIKIIKLNENY